MTLQNRLGVAEDCGMRMPTMDRDLTSSDQFGCYFSPDSEVTTVPRGRATGLMGALAMAVAPISLACPLPLTDLESLTDVVTMFDYDPSMAVDLDVNLD